MDAVWAHIEDGWDLNPEVGFEAAKSEVNDSVAIDGIDMLAAVVLVELARQPFERDHARSVEEFLRFGVGVVVVVIEIRAFAEAWIRTAIRSKQKNPRANSKSGMSHETLGPFSKCSGLDGSGGPSEWTRSSRLSCRAMNSFSLSPNSGSPVSA